MVMGPTHAMSGAAAWLIGVGAITTATGYEQSPIELAVYTAVCAGSALLPDLDCSGRVLSNQGGSTVARTFGVVSLFVAECVEKFSLGVYKLTQSKKDGKRRNGHRTFTHTWIFAALVGFGLSALVTNYERWTVIVTLFLTLGLAIRGLLAEWARKSGWVLITITTTAITITAIQNLPVDRGYPLLGIAVGIGCFVHTLGDMITRAGCPVLWPMPIKGERWYEIGLTNSIALRAGGRLETAVLLPLLTILTVGAAIWQFPTSRQAVEAAYWAVA